MTLRKISSQAARRLAVAAQRLDGPLPSPDTDGIMEVVRALGCLQLDPISVVARSHLIVLWSRLGPFDRAVLDRLLWQERKLFEYWAHCASIVLTEDYPIYSPQMRGYPKGDTDWAKNVRDWIKRNASLRRTILRELESRGPLPSRYFEEMGHATENWVSTGWTSGRNISRMLDFLWMQGKIMVAGRAGLQKLWDLSERCLPDWTPREPLSQAEVVRAAALKSLGALGVATERDIGRHFIRYRYPGLARTLAGLEKEGIVERVEVMQDGAAVPGTWYMRAEDSARLEEVEANGREPRTTLLSPFDNLICDRDRTRRLFDFDYTIEIYTPKEKRRYGYYVLPILHGDRLIGRLDPAFDREQGRLIILSVHTEGAAGREPGMGRAVGAAVRELAVFLGAKEIVYSRRVPAAWRRELTR